jgi:hypothetical protein
MGNGCAAQATGRGELFAALLREKKVMIAQVRDC